MREIQAALGHADVLTRRQRRRRQGQRVVVGQPDVFTGDDNQAPADVERVFACRTTSTFCSIRPSVGGVKKPVLTGRQHPCQPVHCARAVAPSQTLV